ncbi:MAG: amidohydrolase family protein [Thermoproteota archaeon]
MDSYQIKGKAYLKDEIIECSIYIEDERIKRISKLELSNVKTINFNSNFLILPALVDLHVHFRDWGQEEKETIETGSLAALAGGVTTVLDMPNTIPPINSVELIKKRIDDFKRKSYVDFGIHCKPPLISEIDEIFNYAFALKFYEEDLPLIPNYKEHIINKRVVVHAQFGLSEFDAVKYVFEHLLDSSNLRFAHISKKESIEIIKEYRKRNPNIFIEVTPHHMFLSYEKLRKKHKGYYSVRPPLATEEDNRYIINSINQGIVDFIATDHAPHKYEEKLSENPPPGYPNLEVYLPLFLTYIKKGLLNFNKTLRCLTENPSKYLGIKKGKIEEGYYADFVIVNMKEEYKIDPSKFYSKSKFSPFEGFEVIGKPYVTIIRGKIIYENGIFDLNNFKPKEIKELRF